VLPKFTNEFKGVLHASLLAMAVLSLTGCEKLPPILKEDLVEFVCSIPLLCKDRNRVILDVAEFNYTDYQLGSIVVQAQEKNDIKSAAFGMVSWSKKQKPPVSIKVWWKIVFDEKLHNLERGYDPKISKNAAPGAVWCEAIVKLNEPFPANPRHLNLHFFPDGHIEATVVESSVPIVEDEEKSKLPRLPVGKYCEKTIDNPWYGVDTSHPGA
jgi:hypothetical protein